jgi:hypothetical protein
MCGPSYYQLREPTKMMKQTLTQLRTLKLDAIADDVEQQLAQPNTGTLSFKERLSLLVDPEASWRDDRRRTRLLKQAHLKYPQAALQSKPRNAPPRRIGHVSEISGHVQRNTQA